MRRKDHGLGATPAGGNSGSYATHTRATPTFNRIRATDTPDWYATSWRDRKTLIERATKEIIEFAGSDAAWDGWSRHEVAVAVTAVTRNRLTGETVQQHIRFSDRRARFLEPVSVTDTIVHEVAHTTVPIHAGHGPEWENSFRSLCRKLGITSSITRGHAFTEAEQQEMQRAEAEKEATAPYLGSCPQGCVFPRTRLPKHNHLCVHCDNQGLPALIIYERNPNRAKGLSPAPPG